jgi:hypothetical protein
MHDLAEALGRGNMIADTSIASEIGHWVWPFPRRALY